MQLPACGPIQPYESSNPVVIARQIDQARWAGIDGFVSSWWGPRDFRDENLKVLLAIAAEKQFRVAPYFETLDNRGPRTESEISAWLEYFIRTYRDEPALMKIGGRPVIVVWQSPQVPLTTWRRVFDGLHSRDLDAAYVALGFDTADLELFDGLHFYGTFDGAALAFARAGNDVRYYSLLHECAPSKLWAASAEPGYDDRFLPGRTGTLRERRNGETYRASLEAAAASEPDWIFISTWNEYPENTYIEPSLLYGEQYLQLTREFAMRWKRA
jgi:hypothetical protein